MAQHRHHAARRNRRVERRRPSDAARASRGPPGARPSAPDPVVGAAVQRLDEQPRPPRRAQGNYRYVGVARGRCHRRHPVLDPRRGQRQLSSSIAPLADRHGGRFPRRHARTPLRYPRSVMSRDRAPFVAQGTWRSGALHVWGWNGESPASAAWLYSGFGRSRWSGEGGWHDSPISYGELSRIELELPSGGRRPVPAVRLDPFGAAVWLSDTPRGDELSPSLAWFAAITQFAIRVVERAPRDTGGHRGGAVHGGPVAAGARPPSTATHWPTRRRSRRRSAATGRSRRPTTSCRRSSTASPGPCSTTAGWRPELGRKRSADVQAVRAVFAALAKPDPVVRTGTDDFESASTDLGRDPRTAPPTARRRTGRTRAGAPHPARRRPRSMARRPRARRRRRPGQLVHRRRRVGARRRAPSRWRAARHGSAHSRSRCSHSPR